MTGHERPPMKNAASICGVIKDLFCQKGYEHKIEEYRSFLLWDDVVGPQIAARTRPKRVRDGVMEVQVDHPIWMQQLQLMKPAILKKLNQRQPETLITGLFFRVAPLPRTATPSNSGTYLPPAKDSLNESDRSYIESITHHIADIETRTSAAELLAKHKCHLKRVSNTDL